MNYVRIDPGTRYEVLRMFQQDGLSTEQIAEVFGIPESLVIKILRTRK